MKKSRQRSIAEPVAWTLREIKKTPMHTKTDLQFNGESLQVIKLEQYWDVHFADGHHEKLYHHINAEKDAIWMWESGRIDDRSLAIGNQLEQSTL